MSFIPIDEQNSEISVFLWQEQAGIAAAVYVNHI